MSRTELILQLVKIALGVFALGLFCGYLYTHG